MQTPINHQSDSQEFEESDKIQALLAFRTIITMLSLIQSERDTENGVAKQVSSQEKRDLRILDALAAISVRRNDVVAVAAQHDKSGNVQVILSVHFVQAGLTITRKPNPSIGPTAFEKLWRFLVARNPRAMKPSLAAASTATNSAASPSPIITEPLDPESSVPQHLKECDPGPKLLEAFLCSEW